MSSIRRFRSVRFTSVCSAILLVALNHVASAQVQPRGAALVTEKNGRETALTDLTAIYTAEGSWIGGAPETKSQSIIITLTRRGNPIPEERLEVKFGDLRELRIDHPTEVRTGTRIWPPPQVTLTEADGSTIRLLWPNDGPGTYEEHDSKGVVKKRASFDHYDFSTGEAQGSPITLRLLTGRAPTQAAGEKAIEIRFMEVLRVVFR